jgi:hypothetical protein
MSRWAELFDALSRDADTIDTLGHNGGELAECRIVSIVSEGGDGHLATPT